MDGDGQFDYRTLPRAEIEYALQHIDGAKFPMNFANARAALEARDTGASPEPPALLDPETDAKYTYWAEKLLAMLIASIAAVALAVDDLMIPYWSRLRMGVIHLHGLAAWIGAFALIVFAAIPFFGGLNDSEHAERLTVVPRFRYIYLSAILLVVVAFCVNFLGPQRLAIILNELGSLTR